MERKANTYLLRDDVFLRLICQNLVISPNEGARISHSAVSENVNRRPNVTPDSECGYRRRVLEDGVFCSGIFLASRAIERHVNTSI